MTTWIKQNEQDFFLPYPAKHGTILGYSYGCRGKACMAYMDNLVDTALAKVPKRKPRALASRSEESCLADVLRIVESYQDRDGRNGCALRDVIRHFHGKWKTEQLRNAFTSLVESGAIYELDLEAKNRTRRYRVKK